PADFAVAAGADVRLRVQGGLGNDVLSVVKGGSLNPFVDGRLDIDLAGGAGTDALTVALPLDMFGGQLWLRADGGPGNDKLSVDVDNSPPAGTARPHFVVSGRGGQGSVTLE